MSAPGATYRRILTSFWTDPDIRRNVREPDAKAVLLYFFTCPDSTLSGLYFQPLDYVAIHTGVPLERVQELVAGFEGRYLTYDYGTEEVFVHAAWKHNVGEEWRPRDNRTKGLLRQIADTHSDRLVTALVSEYPEWEWPPEVLERVSNRHDDGPEGAPKGLPSRNHSDPHGGGEPVGTRGSKASHAHALAHTHASAAAAAPRASQEGVEKSKRVSPTGSAFRELVNWLGTDIETDLLVLAGSDPERWAKAFRAKWGATPTMQTERMRAGLDADDWRDVVRDAVQALVLENERYRDPFFRSMLEKRCRDRVTGAGSEPAGHDPLSDIELQRYKARRAELEDEGLDPESAAEQAMAEIRRSA